MKTIKRLITAIIGLSLIFTLVGCDLLSGERGKSAYEIAVEHGFVGTEVEWLESLKGDTGEKGETGNKGDSGDDGSSGKSAYEIAVDNGYGGTEEQWLATLESSDGKSAYQIALDNGFSGTEAQWLASLNGADGKSAYQLAVANGYEGTEAQWLADLNGADGKSAYQLAVANGYEGTEAQWLADLNGADGKSAYQLAVANGYEGTEEEWLNSLNGKDGADGEDADNLVYELYTEAKADGYDGTFAQFLDDYGTVIESCGVESNAVAVSKAIKSAVIIYTRYDYTGATSPKWSAGAGVILEHDKVSGNAYIVTNYHVIHNEDNENGNYLADYAEILLYGSITPIEATIVGGVAEKDIAVLKITGSAEYAQSACEPVTVADSDEVVLGQRTIAIGNPEGDGFSATTGTLSVDSESIELAISSGEYVSYRVMRVDTAINGGNSGGGLFNAKGELIGIVNAKLNSSTIDNMAYALPANESIATARNIIRNGGTYTPHLLGISIAPAESKAVYDTATGTVRIEEVVRIKEVTETGKAYGKLREGDIVLSMTYGTTTKEITRYFQVGNFLIGCDGGSSTIVTVKVKRTILMTEVEVEVEIDLA